MSDIQAAIVYARNEQAKFLEKLVDFVKIPSISTDPTCKEHMEGAVNWLTEQLQEIGFSTKVLQTQLHPLIYAERIVDPAFPTLLIYGHYDVQPAEPLEKWTVPPFDPVRKDDLLYGRGVSDMKGQVMACHFAVESILKTDELNLNLKWLIEGEEEIGSPSINAVLEEHAELFRADLVFNTDAGMIAAGLPTITYGLRGLAYFELKVYGPSHDLHSGTFGGAVDNPAQVLCQLIAGMKDNNGKITLPGFYDQVDLVDDDEREKFKRLPFNDDEIKQLAGVDDLWGEAGYSAIERTSIRPSLDVNGLYSGFTGEGSKTIIPAYAMAKISMRLVPSQDPAKVQQQLANYLQSNCPETCEWELTLLGGSPASVMSLKLPALEALDKALEQTFQTQPVYHREGGSVPIVYYLKEVLGCDTLMTGLGLPDSNIHGPDEKLNLSIWYQGIEAYIQFLFNLEKLESIN